jgi:hypothetical protein
MKTKRITVAVLLLLCGTVLNINAQGYIVQNGVETNSFPGEINVWNPGTQATTFLFNPLSKQQPTVYTNVFGFSEPVTIGVRVFLVSPNDPISLQPILSGTWTELGYASSYVFAAGVPFYVGLYTGSNIAPPYPPTQPYTYLDPVFGWAELENVNGTIQVLNSALEYGGAGIYAGTQTIIQPVPEPSMLALSGLGGLLLVCRRWRKSA